MKLGSSGVIYGMQTCFLGGRLTELRLRWGIFLHLAVVYDNSCSVPSDNSGRPSVAGESFAGCAACPCMSLPVSELEKSRDTGGAGNGRTLSTCRGWRSRLGGHINRRKRVNMKFFFI